MVMRLSSDVRRLLRRLGGGAGVSQLKTPCGAAALTSDIHITSAFPTPAPGVDPNVIDSIRSKEAGL
jgi:hypothetical protein